MITRILLFVCSMFLFSCEESFVPESLLIKQVSERFAITEERGMVQIPGGKFEMGNDLAEQGSGESPLHPVVVNSFWMDKTEVTNAEFAEFVKATGYKTIAEQKPDWEQLRMTLPGGTARPHDSLLVPASLVFYPNPNVYDLGDYKAWWKWIPGADWKHPQGPNSSIKNKENHPVVQVAWQDAKAYCEWRKKRLPTEAEWEWAARGALERPLYTWGNTDPSEMIGIGNFFQGTFPIHDLGEDGFIGTAPVKSFPPNGYELYDMAGNVWEWCSDLYDPKYYSSCLSKGLVINPSGPSSSYDPEEPMINKRVIRGGSFLCSPSYCTGYKISRRMKSSEDTSMEHTGFRCACDSLIEN